MSQIVAGRLMSAQGRPGGLEGLRGDSASYNSGQVTKVKTRSLSQSPRRKFPTRFSNILG